MATLLERVRRALAPEYDVERELAEGGMGHVFLGREIALNRPVAIKLLRPELATAVNAERFLREARVLASVTHPNVVSIFAVGPAEGRDGLFYFVMEYLPGTLDQLIAERPLTPEAVVRLGTALLEGLAKVHRSGVVHRDIKPSNIFLREGAPVLGDFGIAKPVAGPDARTLTEPGHYAGTPAYMAPEQLARGGATASSDLYATAMVLYEALTGRRWTGVGEPEAADWHDVSRLLAPVLQRGLALEPAERWATAERLAEALEQAAASARRRGRATARSRRPWLVFGMAAALMVAGYALWRSSRAASPDAAVAVLPPVVMPQDSELAEKVGYATCQNLERAFVTNPLRVTPCRLAEEWWARRVSDDSLPPSAWPVLHTRRIAWSRMDRTADSVSITLEVLSPDGRMSPGGVIRGTVGEVNNGDLGYRVAQAIVQVVEPSRAREFVGSPLRGKSAIVLDTLMAGDRAFWSESWSAAEHFYRRAVELDSSLAQAWWGLYNVLRWSRVASPTDSVDLRAVLARYGGDLPSRDLLLMQADTAMGRPRVAGYLRVIRKFPYDAYPRLILGAELVHRGPLMGIDTDSAIAVLQSAAALDSSLSPIYSTLAMALIRQGDSAAAEAALTLYRRTASQITAEDFSVYSMLQQVWVERFAPERARTDRAQVLGSAEGVSLAKKARFGLALGVPEAQLELSELLAAYAPDPPTRASALVGEALALVALGRPIEAIRHLDSAAATAGHTALGAELAFQAAEWRVLLPAVGVPGVSDTLRQQGRAALRRFAADPAFGARAAWAVAVDAFASGDTAVGADWIPRIAGSDSLTTRLRDLAAALQLAARGDTGEALRRAEAPMAFAPGYRLGDPFSRAVLYVARGRWLAATDDARAADRAWLWYLNIDAAGWPSGAPQAGEIDWALETHGRYLRAGLARAAGESGRVCTLLRDVVTRWRRAEPAYAALQRDAAEATATCAH